MSKFILFILILVSLSACNEGQDNKSPSATTKAQVKITSIRKGLLPDYLTLTGKTVYYNKNTIVAPINGYVKEVFVEQGDHVSKGRVLFEMLTKEAFAMQHNDSLALQYGSIKIKAPCDGIITSLNVVQKGVYIEQGSAMCTIIGANDLKLVVEIPFEYNKYATIGTTCKVQFPDNSTCNAVFTKVLPQMNETSQTMRIQANLNCRFFVPEKMRLKVLLNKKKDTTKFQILPKSCIMTDALLSHYWVMRLINDSTAVQTPVTLGTQTHDSTEIITPKFAPDDKFIEEGAYGLEDTVFVEVIH